MAHLARRNFLAGALALAPSLAHAQAGAADAPLIAAAASVRFPLDIVAARFTAETGRQVRITYGSSGNFTQQLLRGAPFQLFLAADEGSVLQLVAAEKTIDGGQLYAEGRIVLFAPHISPFTPDATFTGLRAALAAGRIQRFAIASPEHAPYGRAAEQALQSQGLWNTIQPRLVFGENIAQAAQFATSGATQGGIIALSSVMEPAVAKLGTHALVPSDWHAALRQRMVLMRGAGETARLFHAFIQSAPARAIFRDYGFTAPAETS